jgi:hypothetical protein
MIPRRPTRSSRQRRWRRPLPQRGPRHDRLPTPPQPPIVLATEDAAASPGAMAMPTSLATLLASHILHDGELVILILRPSYWFVLLQSLPHSLLALGFALIFALANGRIDRGDTVYFEAAAFLIAGRVMWSILQWMGRLYILTEFRIVRLSGVFTIDIFDCPLRKVARTRLTATTGEKLLAVGSIEIEPKMELVPTGVWQTIPNPRAVHEKIVATIARANQNGMGG